MTSTDTARLGLARTPTSSPQEPRRSRLGQFAGICPGFRLGKIRSAGEHAIEHAPAEHANGGGRASRKEAR
ncbi:hypothetical protein ACFCW4_33525, partial [Streptomyces virginiae]|uniref:hypothetical protein n=1 Tax=Streptomyces virginiae TaxID=1961 RepID=UPI0035DB7CA3